MAAEVPTKGKEKKIKSEEKGGDNRIGKWIDEHALFSKYINMFDRNLEAVTYGMAYGAVGSVSFVTAAGENLAYEGKGAYHKIRPFGHSKYYEAFQASFLDEDGRPNAAARELIRLMRTEDGLKAFSDWYNDLWKKIHKDHGLEVPKKNADRGMQEYRIFKRKVLHQILDLADADLKAATGFKSMPKYKESPVVARIFSEQAGEDEINIELKGGYNLELNFTLGAEDGIPEEVRDELRDIETNVAKGSVREVFHVWFYNQVKAQGLEIPTPNAKHYDDFIAAYNEAYKVFISRLGAETLSQREESFWATSYDYDPRPIQDEIDGNFKPEIGTISIPDPDNPGEEKDVQGMVIHLGLYEAGDETNSFITINLEDYFEDDGKKMKKDKKEDLQKKMGFEDGKYKFKKHSHYVLMDEFLKLAKLDSMPEPGHPNHRLVMAAFIEFKKKVLTGIKPNKTGKSIIEKGEEALYKGTGIEEMKSLKHEWPMIRMIFANDPVNLERAESMLKIVKLKEEGRILDLMQTFSTGSRGNGKPISFDKLGIGDLTSRYQAAEELIRAIEEGYRDSGIRDSSFLETQKDVAEALKDVRKAIQEERVSRFSDMFKNEVNRIHRSLTGARRRKEDIALGSDELGRVSEALDRLEADEQGKNGRKNDVLLLVRVIDLLDKEPEVKRAFVEIFGVDDIIEERYQEQVEVLNGEIAGFKASVEGDPDIAEVRRIKAEIMTELDEIKRFYDIKENEQGRMEADTDLVLNQGRTEYDIRRAVIQRKLLQLKRLLDKPGVREQLNDLGGAVKKGRSGQEILIEKEGVMSIKNLEKMKEDEEAWMGPEHDMAGDLDDWAWVVRTGEIFDERIESTLSEYNKLISGELGLQFETLFSDENIDSIDALIDFMKNRLPIDPKLLDSPDIKEAIAGKVARLIEDGGAAHLAESLDKLRIFFGEEHEGLSPDDTDKVDRVSRLRSLIMKNADVHEAIQRATDEYFDMVGMDNIVKIDPMFTLVGEYDPKIVVESIWQTLQGTESDQLFAFLQMLDEYFNKDDETSKDIRGKLKKLIQSDEAIVQIVSERAEGMFENITIPDTDVDRMLEEMEILHAILSKYDPEILKTDELVEVMQQKAEKYILSKYKESFHERFPGDLNDIVTQELFLEDFIRFRRQFGKELHPGKGKNRLTRFMPKDQIESAISRQDRVVFIRMIRFRAIQFLNDPETTDLNDVDSIFDEDYDKLKKSGAFYSLERNFTVAMVEAYKKASVFSELNAAEKIVADLELLENGVKVASQANLIIRLDRLNEYLQDDTKAEHLRIPLIQKRIGAYLARIASAITPDSPLGTPEISLDTAGFQKLWSAYSSISGLIEAKIPDLESSTEDLYANMESLKQGLYAAAIDTLVQEAPIERIRGRMRLVKEEITIKNRKGKTIKKTINKGVETTPEELIYTPENFVAEEISNFDQQIRNLPSELMQDPEMRSAVDDLMMEIYANLAAVYIESVDDDFLRQEFGSSETVRINGQDVVYKVDDASLNAAIDFVFAQAKPHEGDLGYDPDNPAPDLPGTLYIPGGSKDIDSLVTQLKQSEVVVEAIKERLSRYNQEAVSTDVSTHEGYRKAMDSLLGERGTSADPIPPELKGRMEELVYRSMEEVYANFPEGEIDSIDDYLEWRNEWQQDWELGFETEDDILNTSKSLQLLKDLEDRIISDMIENELSQIGLSEFTRDGLGEFMTTVREKYRDAVAGNLGVIIQKHVADYLAENAAQFVISLDDEFMNSADVNQTGIREVIDRELRDLLGSTRMSENLMTRILGGKNVLDAIEMRVTINAGVNFLNRKLDDENSYSLTMSAAIEVTGYNVSESDPESQSMSTLLGITNESISQVIANPPQEALSSYQKYRDWRVNWNTRWNQAFPSGFSATDQDGVREQLYEFDKQNIKRFIQEKIEGEELPDKKLDFVDRVGEEISKSGVFGEGLVDEVVEELRSQFTSDEFAKEVLDRLRANTKEVAIGNLRYSLGIYKRLHRELPNLSTGSNQTEIDQLDLIARKQYQDAAFEYSVENANTPEFTQLVNQVIEFIKNQKPDSGEHNESYLQESHILIAKDFLYSAEGADSFNNILSTMRTDSSSEQRVVEILAAVLVALARPNAELRS